MVAAEADPSNMEGEVENDLEGVEEEDNSNHDDGQTRKIHVSRIPSSFDEAVVKRVMEEHVGKDTVEEVALIYKRPDAEEEDADGTTFTTTKDNKKKESKESSKSSSKKQKHGGDDDDKTETEHRGFGFVTFCTDDSYQKALTMPSIRCGRKATSNRKHTLYLRPYAEKGAQEICYLWAKHRCPYGDDCKFVHEGDGGCLIIVPSAENNKKKQKCFAFKKGKCKRGDQCPFSHDFKPSVAAATTDNATAKDQDDNDDDKEKAKDVDKGNKKRKRDNSEKDCINWKTKGKCRKGDKCPYRHDEALREAALLKKKNKKRKQQEGADAGNTESKRQRQPLWVRLFGLNYDTREHDVREFLQHCGTIMEVQFPRFEDSGRSKGYCGVLFQSPKAVAKALELDGEELMGRWLRIQAGKMLLDQWEDREKQPKQTQSNYEEEQEAY